MVHLLHRLYGVDAPAGTLYSADCYEWSTSTSADRVCVVERTFCFTLDCRQPVTTCELCSATCRSAVRPSVCLSVTTADTTVSLTKTDEPIVVLFGWNMDSSGPNEPCIRRWPGLFFGYENYDSVTETLLETGLSSFDTVCANASFNFHLRLSYPIFVSCILLAF